MYVIIEPNKSSDVLISFSIDLLRSIIKLVICLGEIKKKKLLFQVLLASHKISRNCNISEFFHVGYCQLYQLETCITI